MLQDEARVLKIPVDDASSNELASILGSPIEAGKCMYTDLQQEYTLSDEKFDKDSDYEFIAGELGEPDEQLENGGPSEHKAADEQISQ